MSVYWRVVGVLSQRADAALEWLQLKTIKSV